MQIEIINGTVTNLESVLEHINNCTTEEELAYIMQDLKNLLLNQNINYQAARIIRDHINEKLKEFDNLDNNDLNNANPSPSASLTLLPRGKKPTRRVDRNDYYIPSSKAGTIVFNLLFYSIAIAALILITIIIMLLIKQKH